MKRGLLWDWELGQSCDERVFRDVIREQEADFQINLTQHLCFQSGNPLTNAHFNRVQKELTHFFQWGLWGVFVPLCGHMLGWKLQEGKEREKLNKSTATVTRDVKPAATHPPFLHRRPFCLTGASTTFVYKQHLMTACSQQTKQGCNNVFWPFRFYHLDSKHLYLRIT